MEKKRKREDVKGRVKGEGGGEETKGRRAARKGGETTTNLFTKEQVQDQPRAIDVECGFGWVYAFVCCCLQVPVFQA